MDNEKILEKVEKYVKKSCLNDSIGHDWYHIERVKNISLKINEEEKKDVFIIKMIATLHDLYDHKFYNGDIYLAIKNLFKELDIIKYLSNEEIENIAMSCKKYWFY